MPTPHSSSTCTCVRQTPPLRHLHSSRRFLGHAAVARLGTSRRNTSRCSPVAHARRRLFGGGSVDDSDAEGSPGGSATSSADLSDMPQQGLAGVPMLRRLMEFERRKALLTDAEDIRQGADLDRISMEVEEAGLGDLEADWAEAEALKQGLTTTGGTGANKAFSPGGGTQLVRPARAPGGLAAWQQQLPLEVQRRLAAQEKEKKVPPLQRPRYLGPSNADEDDDEWDDGFEFLEEADDSWQEEDSSKAAAGSERSPIPAMTADQKRQMALKEVQSRRSAMLQAMKAQQREKDRRKQEDTEQEAATPAAAAASAPQQPAAAKQQQQQPSIAQQQPQSAARRIAPTAAAPFRGAQATASQPTAAARRTEAPVTDFEAYIAMRQAEKAAQKAAEQQAMREAAAQRLMERQSAALAAMKASAEKAASAQAAAQAYEKMLSDPSKQAAIQRLRASVSKVKAPTPRGAAAQQEAAKPQLQERPLTPAAAEELERQQQAEEEQQLQQWEAQLEYVQWAAQAGSAADAQQRIMTGAAQPLPALTQQQQAAADRAAQALQSMARPKASRPVGRANTASTPPAAAAAAAGPKAAKQQDTGVQETAAAQQQAPALAPADADAYAAWAAEVAAEAAAAEQQATAASTAAAEAALQRLAAMGKAGEQQQARLRASAAALNGLQRPPPKAPAAGPRPQASAAAKQQDVKVQDTAAQQQAPALAPADAEAYSAWAAEVAAEAAAAEQQATAASTAAAEAALQKLAAMGKAGEQQQARLRASAAALNGLQRPPPIAPLAAARKAGAVAADRGGGRGGSVWKLEQERSGAAPRSRTGQEGLQAAGDRQQVGTPQQRRRGEQRQSSNSGGSPSKQQQRQQQQQTAQDSMSPDSDSSGASSKQAPAVWVEPPDMTPEQAEALARLEKTQQQRRTVKPERRVEAGQPAPGNGKQRPAGKQHQQRKEWQGRGPGSRPRARPAAGARGKQLNGVQAAPAAGLEHVGSAASAGGASS